jgi:CRISPR/Cas system endoribonuclease Cas6 (RAMP superfamily)
MKYNSNYLFLFVIISNKHLKYNMMKNYNCIYELREKHNAFSRVYRSIYRAHMRVERLNVKNILVYFISNFNSYGLPF